MAIVKSAERTLRCLELVAHHRNGILFTEIQDGLAIPKSSAHNLIQELLSNGYLLFNEATNRYYVGLEFVKLCTICMKGTDLLQELQILTSELGQEIGQTTHACVLDGIGLRYLAKFETNPGISSMNAIGDHIPAHCTASGKMLLSQFSNQEVAELYGGQPLEMLTDRSINSIDRLLSELDETRRRGYALEFGESKDFAACIAIPLYQKEKMIAAFSVTYPIYQLQTADHDEIVRIMRKYQEITHRRLMTR